MNDPLSRAREASGADLDAEFDRLVDALRVDFRGFRQQVDAFERAYAAEAERQPAEPDETTRRAHRRLKQLQLVAQHLESSASFLLGSGIEPSQPAASASVEMGRRVLESLEAERARLYREIHDGPAQVLANSIFEVEYLERIVERAPAEVRATLRAELADLKRGFKASLDSVRAIIYDLRPPELTAVGLAEALRNFASEYEARYGLSVRCHLDTSETGLTPMQELAVYRVMQEALQNTHKHAHASHVSLVWQRSPAGWQLHCTDDGVGFDLVKAARQPACVGLLSMRERAELVGGSLQVRSTPGEGTAVTLLIPLDRGDNARG